MAWASVSEMIVRSSTGKPPSLPRRTDQGTSAVTPSGQTNTVLALKVWLERSPEHLLGPVARRLPTGFGGVAKERVEQFPDDLRQHRQLAQVHQSGQIVIGTGDAGQHTGNRGGAQFHQLTLVKARQLERATDHQVYQRLIVSQPRPQLGPGGVRPPA